MADSTRLTLDNMGIGVSQTYAENQKRLDTPLARDIRESGGMSKKAQVDVFNPVKSSELDALIGPSQLVRTIADFHPPSSVPTSQIFSFGLIPSCPVEKQDALAARINEQVALKQKNREADLKKVAQVKDPNDTTKRQLWQMQREGKEEELEKNHLLSLFERVKELNACLIQINAGRNQYQRG